MTEEQSSPFPSEGKISSTYRALVGSPDDLVGLVSYALYKQDKLDFLERYETDHGTVPADVAIDAFCRTAMMPAIVETYRDRAGRLLESMTSEVLRPTMADIKDDYDNQLALAVQKFHPHSFWRAVGEHALAGFVVWLVVAAIVVCAYAAKKGVKSAAETLFGVRVEDISK